jgi:hypothetical protein
MTTPKNTPKKKTGVKSGSGKPANKRPATKRPAATKAAARRTSHAAARPPAKPVRRWFGVPRWIVLAVLVGLAGFVGVFGPWTAPSARVQTIVAALRTSTVYIEPGQHSGLDPVRARQAVGDRPIAVVALRPGPLPAGRTEEGDDDAQLAFCEQIAKQLSGDYVLLFSTDSDTGKYTPADCYGARFPKPDRPGKDMDGFDLAMSFDSYTGSQFLASPTDLAPDVEEFVLAFDSNSAEYYSHEPGRGAAAPDQLAVRDLVLAGLAMVLGAVALFVLLRLAGRLLSGRVGANQSRRLRHAALSTTLNAIAEQVLNPRPDPAAAARQADLAKRYVLALDEVERAHTPAELTGAERTVAGLVDELKKEPVG